MAIDVASWLQQLGLAQYEPAFRDNEVDGDVLPDLTAEDLIAIGVTPVGHRRKLLSAIAAIRRYDGFVAKYMGDGILVYFGYPRAHEDEAERSARAALDIVDAMAELNAAVPRPPAVELAVRIGIATGPVIVGDQIGEGT